MKNRIILILLLLMAALYSFANKKMTIRDIDTGESFEVSIPDDVKIRIPESVMLSLTTI